MNVITNIYKDQINRSAPVMPAVLSYCSDLGTPVAIFEKLSRNEENAFLFESTEGDSRLARYSILGIDPCFTISFSDGTATNKARDGSVKQETVSNPIQYLNKVLRQRRNQLAMGDTDNGIDTKNGIGCENARANVLDTIAHLPFIGGFVGYMGYAATKYLDNIPEQRHDPFKVPDGYYGFYDSCVVFDHQFKSVTVISFRGSDHAHEIVSKMSAPSTLMPLYISQNTLGEAELFDNVECSFTKEHFLETVEKAKHFIKEGQAFQIVLSRRFSTQTSAKSIDIYRMLTATNPSPYAYYLKCPNFVYLGSSPETFVQCRNGRLLLRALAGTRRRGSTLKEDESLAAELKGDEKEMAEHRMLVDLGRNDLGRVCQPGSIVVGEIASLTKYTHVMHLATELTGTLSSKLGSFDAFQSCFPAGTVSGAPKVRAMQLLSSLEPEKRGIYSGSVGYFDLNDNMDGAIAIRSVLIKDQIAHINAGAGLVYDSQPEMEYEETRNKAKSVLQAIKLADRLSL